MTVTPLIANSVPATSNSCRYCLLAMNAICRPVTTTACVVSEIILINNVIAIALLKEIAC